LPCRLLPYCPEAGSCGSSLAKREQAVEHALGP
jgi:hypothetical protein